MQERPLPVTIAVVLVVLSPANLLTALMPGGHRPLPST